MKKLLQNLEKRKIWSDAKKGKRNPIKRKCKNKKNQNLPKYIVYYQMKVKETIYKGYRVDSHPNMKQKTKSFMSMKLTMDEKLNLAKEYILNLKL